MDPSDAERGGSGAVKAGFSPRAGFWETIGRFFRVGATARTAKAEQKPVHDDVSSTGAKIPDDKLDDLVNGEYTKVEAEGACTKLWNVYLGEAERYDRMLVESWKGDMNGMLIFSGLFSASLTAFIIESYKTLQPDPQDLTVVLLTQISAQLALASGSSAPDAAASLPFQATTAALLCNVLWFISLALSLTCSLLATLVEQWAREFLHKTDIHPAPVRRARVFSFLYLGLKQFRMHIVVDVIPMLLHVSLFLFFGGLIAFLLPVNAVLMYLMSGILAGFFCLYIILTVLPVVRRASPYRTPLSGALWRLKQFFDKYTGAPSQDHDRSMTEAVSDEALKEPEERDRHAVQWTVTSLTDDNELLPFVEAIPDAICGSKGFYLVSDHLFLPLLNTSDPQQSITTRIVDLLRSSENPLLDKTSRTRRQTACLKAIWALAMIPNIGSPQRPPIFWFPIENIDLYTSGSGPEFADAARAGIHYHRLNTTLHRIFLVDKILDSRDLTSEASELENVQIVRALLDGTEGRGLPLNLLYPANHLRALQDMVLTDHTLLGPAEVTALLNALAKTLKALTTHPLWNTTSVDVLVQYLAAALRAGSCPYQFFATCQRLLPDHPDSIGQVEDPYYFHYLFYHINDPGRPVPLTSEVHDVDRIVTVCCQLLPFLSESTGARARALWQIYLYFSKRKSDAAVSYILSHIDLVRLQTSIIQDLQEKEIPPMELFETLWLLCKHVLMPMRHWSAREYRRRSLVDQLKLYSSISPHRPSCPTVVAMVSCLVLDHFEKKVGRLRPDSSLDTLMATLQEMYDHPLCLSHLPLYDDLEPPISFHAVYEVRERLGQQLKEIRMFVLGQLLSSYMSDSVLYEGYSTIDFVGSDSSASDMNLAPFRALSGPVRPEYQRIYFDGVRTVVQCLAADPTNVELRKTTDRLWNMFWDWGWINDPEGASICADALDTYFALAKPDAGVKVHFDSPSETAHCVRQQCSLILDSTKPSIQGASSTPRSDVESHISWQDAPEHTNSPRISDAEGGSDEAGGLSTGTIESPHDGSHKPHGISAPDSPPLHAPNESTAASVLTGACYDDDDV